MKTCLALIVVLLFVTAVSCQITEERREYYHDQMCAVHKDFVNENAIQNYEAPPCK